MVLKQIKMDVARTFRPWNLKFLSSNVMNGRNKLYNMLKVYATVLDPELGYTQGMNFVAAVILMNVPNEILACQIFTKLLDKGKWSQIYLPSTPKLFDFSANLLKLLNYADPELFEFF